MFDPAPSFRSITGRRILARDVGARSLLPERPGGEFVAWSMYAQISGESHREGSGTTLVIGESVTHHRSPCR
jgi:hypothetical protein